MRREQVLPATVLLLLLCLVNASDAGAKVFVHLYQGYTLWYPDHWHGGEPPSDAQDWFSASTLSLSDEERHLYRHDPCPDGLDVATMWLRVKEGASCRATLEEQSAFGGPYVKWDEPVIGHRTFLRVQVPQPEMTFQFACWSDGHRLFVFVLNVCTPSPRYHEYVEIWQKVIASLRLTTHPESTGSAPSTLPR